MPLYGPRSLRTTPGNQHLAEWSCELLGTALLLLGGLSAVCLDFGPHSPLRGLGSSVRLLLTGLLFAGTGSLLAISPLGRRSGAHLNPVVTLAFWTQRKVHRTTSLATSPDAGRLRQRLLARGVRCTRPSRLSRDPCHPLVEEA